MSSRSRPVGSARSLRSRARRHVVTDTRPLLDVRAYVLLTVTRRRTTLGDVGAALVRAAAKG